MLAFVLVLLAEAMELKHALRLRLSRCVLSAALSLEIE